MYLNSKCHFCTYISGRSPLYSHISATIQGLAIIRASEEQTQFKKIYNDYQDHNTSASFYYLAANRWLGYRLDMICAAFMTSVAFAPFIVHEAGSSKLICCLFVCLYVLASTTSFPGPLSSEACGRQRPWQRLVVT